MSDFAARIGDDGDVYEFKVPAWVQPGNHVVRIRTLAQNDAFAGSYNSLVTATMSDERLLLNGEALPGPATTGGEQGGAAISGASTANAAMSGRVARGQAANLALEAHAAVVEIPVMVSGRMYDLKVTDMGDPMWETFFRTAKGSAQPTGKVFDTGLYNINGDVDPARQYQMPVMPGKNDEPGYLERAVKLGYRVYFELKTIGPFHGAGDAIRIHPTFDKNGQNRQEVDLYYATPTDPLIRVGSAEDVLVTKGGLDLKWQNLSSEDILAAARANWRLWGGVPGFATAEAYAQACLKQVQVPSDMYRPWRIMLTPSVRLYRGPTLSMGSDPTDPAGAAELSTLAYASMQRWLGEWSLPADTLIVPAGTDLSQYGPLAAHHPVFLKEGYLVVNFRDIELIRNGDFAHPVLNYSGRATEDGPDAGGAIGAGGVESGGIDGAADRTVDPASWSVLPADVLELGNGWLLEGYRVQQSGWDLREGDAVVFYANRRATDDLQGLGTH
jgi:hypothetical protein